MARANGERRGGASRIVNGRGAVASRCVKEERRALSPSPLLAIRYSLAYRRPRAVRIAAGGPAGDLGPSVNVDRVAIFAAAHSASRIVGSGNNRPVIGRMVAAPPDRGAGRAAVQGLHLRRVGALAILLVHGRPDGAAKETARRSTDRRAREPVTHAVAAESGPQGSPRQRAGDGAGILIGSIWIIGTRPGTGGDDRYAYDLQRFHDRQTPLPAAAPAFKVSPAEAGLRQHDQPSSCPKRDHWGETLFGKRLFWRSGGARLAPRPVRRQQTGVRSRPHFSHSMRPALLF